MSSRIYLDINYLRQRREKRSKILSKLNLNKQTGSKLLQNSLKQYVTKVYDQGALGSCTANAFCSAFNIENTVKKKYPNFQPSRLYLYYYERQIEGTTNFDSGADVIDGEKYAKQYGLCSEELWPYKISKFTVKPPLICDTDAGNHKITSYRIIPINNLLIQTIKNCIDNNTPVLIAIAVYTSFESKNAEKTGIIPIPNLQKEKCLGGHELCLIGYDDVKSIFTVQNSWGSNWGDNGFCYIPYNYLTNKILGLEFTCIYL
jgi:C1A family cysteine protease